MPRPHVRGWRSNGMTELARTKKDDGFVCRFTQG